MLPYTDGLVVSLLRTALTAVDIGTLVPADLTVHPRAFLLVRRVGGAAVHPVHLDAPTVDVDAFAPTRRGAHELADAARVALWTAWRRQTVTPTGHLAHVREITGPAELRTQGQPDDLYRFHASYALATRPARTPSR